MSKRKYMNFTLVRKSSVSVTYLDPSIYIFVTEKFNINNKTIYSKYFKNKNEKSGITKSRNMELSK